MKNQAGFITLLLFAAVASAQTPSWTRTSTGLNPNQLHPAVRDGGGMAYDGVRHQSILFGGLGGGTQGPTSRSDTWAYTGGGTWAQFSPATVPPGRFGNAMVFDSQHGNITMFGGGFYNNNVVIFTYNDTWTWNGTNWTQLFPSVSPSARYLVGAAYDTTHNQMVVFGGVGVAGYLGDTWVFNGTNWTQKFPAHAPPARAAGMMVYDPLRAKVYLFGGVNNLTYYGDTWAWDGTDWTQLSPANFPSARYGSGIAFDNTLGVSVLYGGTNNNTGNFAETWTFDGTNWTKMPPNTQSPNPSKRFYTSFDYDSFRGMVVMFGGGEGMNLGDIYLQDTWEYK
jgi:hypothetical protein